MTIRLLPIFPLPDVVLLPETTLPLHVFEPRYTEMLSDALEGDRTIGIQRVRQGHDELGRPAVYDIGCAGEIVEHEPLEDGRSNIVLKGTFRYRIDREPRTGKPYRIAEISPLPVRPLPKGTLARAGSDDLRRLLNAMVRHLAISVGRSEAGLLPDELSDEGLVNEAASRLGLDADERYSLLAMEDLEGRYAWVMAHVSSLQRRVEMLAPFRQTEIEPRWN